MRAESKPGPESNPGNSRQKKEEVIPKEKSEAGEPFSQPEASQASPPPANKEAQAEASAESNRWEQLKETLNRVKDSEEQQIAVARDYLGPAGLAELTSAQAQNLDRQLGREIFQKLWQKYNRRLVKNLSQPETAKSFTSTEEQEISRLLAAFGFASKEEELKSVAAILEKAFSSSPAAAQLHKFLTATIPRDEKLLKLVLGEASPKFQLARSALENNQIDASNGFTILQHLKEIREQLPENGLAQRLTDKLEKQIIERIGQQLASGKIENEADIARLAMRLRPYLRLFSGSLPLEISQQLVNATRQVVEMAAQGKPELMGAWQDVFSWLSFSLPNDPGQAFEALSGQRRRDTLTAASLSHLLKMPGFAPIADIFLAASANPASDLYKIKNEADFEAWLRKHLLNDKKLQEFWGNEENVKQAAEFLYHGPLSLWFPPEDYPKKAQGLTLGSIGIGQVSQRLKAEGKIFPFERQLYYDPKKRQALGPQIHLGAFPRPEAAILVMNKKALETLEAMGYRREKGRRLEKYNGKDLGFTTLFVKEDSEGQRVVEVFLQQGDGEERIAALVEMRRETEKGKEEPITFTGQELSQLLANTKRDFLAQIAKKSFGQPSAFFKDLAQNILPQHFENGSALAQTLSDTLAKVSYLAEANSNDLSPAQINKSDIVTALLEVYYQAKQEPRFRRLVPGLETPNLFFRSLLIALSENPTIFETDNARYLARQIWGLPGLLDKLFGLRGLSSRASLSASVETYVAPFQIPLVRGHLLGGWIGQFFNLLLKAILGSPDSKALQQALGI